MKKYIFVTLAIISISFIVYLTITSFIFKGDWAVRGQFGDTFGFMNTLFSALAFAGVVYTLNLQRRDSELAIKPHLAIEPDERVTGFKIRVTNIGNGTAMNIEFEPLLLDPGIDLIFKADKRIMFLKAGESADIEILSVLSGKVTREFSWHAHLGKEHSNRDINVWFTYSDIDNKKMKQTFVLGMGDLKVTMPQDA